MTPDEQATFNRHCEIERQTTILLAGKTEDELDDEQEIALVRYMRIRDAVYLALYGPLRPRGAHLREETQAEAAARWAWEETLKTDEQRLQERLGAAVHAYWREWVGDTSNLHVQYIDEVTDGQSLGDWQEDIQEYDRLFQVSFREGSSHDYIDCELWLTVRWTDMIEVLQARCVGFSTSDTCWCKPCTTDIPQEAREYLRAMFGGREQAV